jgi:hypothetical protein
VQAFSAPRRLGGLIGAYIATSPEREAEAREGLLAEFARLVDAPVGDEELRRAQTYALGTHAIARQGGGALLGDLVDAWLLGDGLAELERFEARVRDVTPARIQAMAARSFEASARVEGIVRGTEREPGTGGAADERRPARRVSPPTARVPWPRPLRTRTASTSSTRTATRTSSARRTSPTRSSASAAWTSPATSPPSSWRACSRRWSGSSRR